MASKKYLEMQQMEGADLASELLTSTTEYRKMKFDHAVQGLENPLQLRDLRKDIARMQTELRRREVAAMTPEELAKRSKIRFRRSSKYN